MLRRFMFPFTLGFIIACGIMCGLLRIACDTEIHLTPDREICAESPGNVWTHAGENFLYTIDK